MTAIGSGRSKLAELVTNHIFADIDRNMGLAVMYSDRVTNKIR